MDTIVRIFSAISYETYISSTVSPPKKLSNPIKGPNEVHNADLIKVKINTGLEPFPYYNTPHSLVISTVPFSYSIFTHMTVLNIWYVYLIVCFIFSNS